jgi:hypothetical protein
MWYKKGNSTVCVGRELSLVRGIHLSLPPHSLAERGLESRPAQQWRMHTAHHAAVRRPWPYALSPVVYKQKFAADA